MALIMRAGLLTRKNSREFASIIVKTGNKNKGKISREKYSYRKYYS